jgi:hypothetical protein
MLVSVILLTIMLSHVILLNGILPFFLTGILLKNILQNIIQHIGILLNVIVKMLLY